MAYVTPMYGGSAAQIDYRLGITQHGCGSDAQVRYQADGRERPLRVDDALALAEAAGLEAEQVWPDVDLIEVYGNLFESTVVRATDVGNHRHNSGYYMCHPMSNNRGRPDKYAGHEKAAHIREDAILEAVSAFYADRVFGSHRRDLLISRPSMTARPGSERPNESACSALSPISPAGRTTSCAKPNDCAPDDPFAQGLRQTYNELEAERRATLAAIAELDAADQAAPTRPTADDAGLLDACPTSRSTCPTHQDHSSVACSRSPTSLSGCTPTATT